ncbi:hypothetical protein J4Q44_G00192190, partial [Coregonus suidteri]
GTIWDTSVHHSTRSAVWPVAIYSVHVSYLRLKTVFTRWPCCKERNGCSSIHHSVARW